MILDRRPDVLKPATSQDQLPDRVWGPDHIESADVVRLYLGYLRRKIELDPVSPKLIENSRGFGYRYRKPR